MINIKTKKYLKVYCSISLLLLLLVMTIYYYGFYIYTFGWHIIKGDVVKWNGLNIDVPKELIAKFEDEELIVYNPEDPSKITVIFRKMVKNMTENYDFSKIYKQSGYDVVETKTFYIVGEKAIWIEAVNSKSKYKKIISIYLISKGIRIFFVGDQNKIQVFMQIFNNINFEKK